MLVGHTKVEQFYGPDHPLALLARQDLVDLYEAWGKPDKADHHRATTRIDDPAAAVEAGADAEGN
jgi:hypothetical protein